MLLLTSTSDLVQLVTSAATSVHVQASYVDMSGATITPGRLNNIIASATTTNVVGSPAASTQRNVEQITVNSVGVGQTVTLQHTDGTHVVQLSSVALAQGERLVFTAGYGFQVFDATGALKQKQQPSPGRFLSRNAPTLTSGNWTSPTSCSTIRLTLIGGGGGGGGTTTTTSDAACGAGGGAGAVLELVVAVQPNTAYAFVIGAAGAAGSSSGGTGGAGGLTSFIVNGITYSAPGGLGGIGQTYGTTEIGSLGGADTAVASNGNVNGAGGGSQFGWRRSGTVGWSGFGGRGMLGGGGQGRIAAGVGNTATGPGGGGGGGLVLNGSTAVAGGAGFKGAILIDCFS